MIKLKHINDTWNMIGEYNIKGYIDQGNAVLIPESEYKRLLDSVKNKNTSRTVSQSLSPESKGWAVM